MASQTKIVGTGLDGGGPQPWTSAGNITADDGLVASVSLPSIGISNQLRGTMGSNVFTVPAGSIINGILVEIKKDTTGSLIVTDNTVQLIKGGVIGGTDHSDAGTWPTVLAYTAYGGSADLWGVTLTAADVNASSFGCEITAYAGTATATAQVDAMRITVYYSADVTLAPPAKVICDQAPVITDEFP